MICCCRAKTTTRPTYHSSSRRRFHYCPLSLAFLMQACLVFVCGVKQLVFTDATRPKERVFRLLPRVGTSEENKTRGNKIINLKMAKPPDWTPATIHQITPTPHDDSKRKTYPVCSGKTTGSLDLTLRLKGKRTFVVTSLRFLGAREHALKLMLLLRFTTPAHWQSTPHHSSYNPLHKHGVIHTRHTRAVFVPFRGTVRQRPCGKGSHAKAREEEQLEPTADLSFLLLRLPLTLFGCLLQRCLPAPACLCTTHTRHAILNQKSRHD